MAASVRDPTTVEVVAVEVEHRAAGNNSINRLLLQQREGGEGEWGE